MSIAVDSVSHDTTALHVPPGLTMSCFRVTMVAETPPLDKTTPETLPSHCHPTAPQPICCPVLTCSFVRRRRMALVCLVRRSRGRKVCTARHSTAAHDTASAQHSRVARHSNGKVQLQRYQPCTSSQAADGCQVLSPPASAARTSPQTHCPNYFAHCRLPTECALHGAASTDFCSAQGRLLLPLQYPTADSQLLLQLHHMPVTRATCAVPIQRAQSPAPGKN
jgi:hypothetical protein